MTGKHDKARENDAHELRAMPRKQVVKALKKCIDNGDIPRLKEMLAAVTLSSEKKKWPFGDAPPAGTIHHDQFASLASGACYRGSPALVQTLIDNGAEDLSGWGCWGLKNAAYGNNRLVIELLIEKGIDPDRVLRNSEALDVHRSLRPYAEKLKRERQLAELKELNGADASESADARWTVLGESCVAWTEAADNGAGLTNVFNFRSREVATAVALPGRDAPGAPAMRAFDDFPDKALLREAAEKLKQAGGGKPLKFRV